MRAPGRITKEQLDEIREKHGRPRTTWADLTREYGLSKARLHQLMNPEAYWRSLQRRAKRNLAKLREERAQAEGGMRPST